MVAIRADAHLPEFHRGAPPQLPVRCATTANVTIATALNAGDTIDGVTLAAGDRVLVKSQTTGAQNGVYIAGASPDRAFDMAEGVAAWGAIVYVIAGTANGGKQFKNTNATLPTIGTTALTWAEVPAVSDHGALTGLADDDHPQYLTQTEGDALYEPLGAPLDPDEVRDAGRWEVVVSGTGPPVAVSNPADDDWLYAWVPG